MKTVISTLVLAFALTACGDADLEKLLGKKDKVEMTEEAEEEVESSKNPEYKQSVKKNSKVASTESFESLPDDSIEAESTEEESEPAVEPTVEPTVAPTPDPLQYIIPAGEYLWTAAGTHVVGNDGFSKRAEVDTPVIFMDQATYDRVMGIINWQ